MLSTADLAKMKADVLDVIGDHSASITIRRGNTTLAAQTVRVERVGRSGSQQKDAAASDQTESRMVVVGDEDLDIALGDRFNALGFLCEVTAVHPNTQIGTQAEAVVIQ